MHRSGGLAVVALCGALLTQDALAIFSLPLTSLVEPDPLSAVEPDPLSCVLVVVDGPVSSVQGVQESAAMAKSHGCRTEVWMVQPGNCSAVRGYPCHVHRNTGRDLGAAAHYVYNHYHDLPSRLLITSSSLDKWDRSTRLKQLFSNLASQHFECPPMGTWQPFLEQDGGFSLACYDDKDLTPAEPYGLMNWALSHVESDADLVHHTRECFNGLWRSTRELLHERPRSFYQRIAAELDVSAANEAVHYAERLAQLIFGGHGLRRRLQQRLGQLQLRLLTERPPCDVAIVVPYRNQMPLNDREMQLKLFVEHMRVFTDEMRTKAACNARVFVIEQSDDKRRFNRGFLVNAGFRLARQEMPNLTSFIVHDVDLLPSDLMVLSYAEEPPKESLVHLAHVLAKYPYENFIGGVFAIQPRDFERVNGFPNSCWGWGNEDDHFKLRLQAVNVSIVKSCRGSYNDTDPVHIGRAWARGMSSQMRSQLNPDKVAAGFGVPTQLDSHWSSDGLANLNFTVLKRRRVGGSNVITVELKPQQDVYLARIAKE